MPPKKKSRRLSRKDPSIPGPAGDHDMTAVTTNIKSPSQTTFLTDFVLEERDWRKGKTLIECRQYMLSNQIACDVFFALGANGDKYGAHKFILLSASDIFYTMFLGPMAERGIAIKMPDIDLDVFRVFLKYLYTEELQADEENVMQLMYVAKKYNIVPMEMAIIDYVKGILTNENVCLVMEQAHIFDVPLLHQMALEFIEDHAPEVLVLPEMSELCEQCLRQILSSDDLHIGLGIERRKSHSENMSEAAKIEKSVLTALLSWTKDRCRKKNLKPVGKNLRAVMKNLIEIVRFPQLDHKYFIRTVSKMNILTTKERCEILERVVMNSNTTSKPRESPIKLRGHHHGTHDVPNPGHVSAERDDKPVHCLVFSGDRAFYLNGFSLYRNLDGKACTYDISASVFRDEELVHEHSTKYEDKPEFDQSVVSSAGIKLYNCSPSYNVFFRRKILLDAHVRYKLIVCAKGPPTFCEEEGKSALWCYFRSDIKIKFFYEDGLQNTVNPYNLDRGGRIPTLIVSCV